MGEDSGALGVAILAGGKGQRLRPDKGCLLVQGTPIVTRVVAAARSLTDQVLIVGSAPLPPGLAVPVAPDEGTVCGPARGLWTALRTLKTTLVVLLAWDMPFVEPGLLRYLAGLAGGHDAVAPRVAGRPQPLCAVYSRSCLPALESLLACAASRGGRGPSLTGLLERLRVRWVEEEELAPFGSLERLFFNINTPEDLARAQELA